MRGITVLSGIMGIFICWSSCVYNSLTPDPATLTLNLRWTKAYATETQQNVTTGLMWSLSYLGATLPPGSMSRVVSWKKPGMLTLDINEAGFPEASLMKWSALILALRETEEYIETGGIDVGRFVTLTLNSSNHYYAITGAHRDLSSFRDQYHFDPRKAAINKSTIALGSRVIEIAGADTFGEIAFVAAEGPGSVLEHTFVEHEFEAMDLMPNGQLRFALYDKDGHLKTSASPELTNAGKPAKCFWCHETHFIAPFQEYPPAEGYYGLPEFTAIVNARVKLIEQYRTTLKSDLDFSKTSDHTQAELLYITFMEPSPGRLAAEWGMSLDAVKQKVTDAPAHKHKEFSFLGDTLYSRKDIEQFSPYSASSVPDEARNFSLNEPAVITP
jgi:hypothetical protein